MKARSVLVVDDDQGTREAVSHFLSEQGYSCASAPDGSQAIQAATPGAFDIVLTDLAMPGLSGMALIKRLRERSPTSSVVVLTGSSTIEEVIGTVREGADDVLFKPVDLTQIRTTLDRIFREREEHGKDERALIKGLVAEKSSFYFKAKDFPREKISLAILERLVTCGRLERVVSQRISLAFQEALANSFDHGTLELESHWKDQFDDEGNDQFAKIKKERLLSKEFGDREVRIESEFDGKSLKLTIQDQGKGFKVQRSAPKQQDELGLASYGRGLALIAGIMDEVHFEDSGRIIIMAKYLA